MSDGPSVEFGPGVVELRVHGVGGTSPGALLGFPDDAAFPPPTREAGDHIAGFYRRPWPATRGRTLEGYSWGGLTSRKGARSLWLLLLPFAMVNAAGWLVEPRRPSAPHPTAPPVRPDTTSLERTARIQMALVRTAAVTLTVLFVAWTAAVFVDLVAFQCGGQTACTDGRWWMLPFTTDRFQAHPARRMILGALVPLALIALVVVVSYRSRNRYEEYTLEDPGPDGDRPAHRSEFGRDGAGLADPEFWASGDYVRRTTLAHVGAAIATVGGLYALALHLMTAGDAGAARPVAVLFAGYLLVVLTRLWASGGAGRREAPRWAWNTYWIVPLALTVGMFIAGWMDGPIVAAAATLPPGSLQPVFARAPLYAVLALVVVITAMAAVHAARWLGDPTKDRVQRIVLAGGWTLVLVAVVWWHRLPVLRSFPTLLATSLVTTSLVAVAVLMARHTPWRLTVTLLAGAGLLVAWYGVATEHRALQWSAAALVASALLPTLAAQLGRRDRWRWAAPVTGASLAGVTLMLAVAGSIIRMADFLDRGPEDMPQIATLQAYDVMALFLVFALVAMLVAALVHYLRIRLDLWGPLRGEIAAEYAADAPPDPTDEFADCAGEDGSGSMVASIVAWRSLAAAARDVDVLATHLALIPLIATLLGLARVGLEVGMSWSGLIDVIETPRVAPDWSWYVTIASWLASLFPLVGVLVVRSAVRNDPVRRAVGIAWDILTFWPRRFHPLGPPAYTERAVPELARRVRQLTRHPGGRVLLTAHSQGGIVATATLAALIDEGGDTPSQVAIVTHGNPAGRLYRRFFPGYFGGGLLRWIRGNLHGGEAWLNVYRLTDPISDAVFTGADEDLALPIPDRTSGDVLVPDPVSKWRFSLDPCPRPDAHSRYLESPAVAAAMDAIATDLRPRAGEAEAG